MTLKHPIRFIKNHQINITLFIILCIFSYFIYKKYKGDLIEGANEKLSSVDTESSRGVSACSSSSTSLCNFNMEMMNRYDKIVDNLQKKIDESVDNITSKINDYKRNRDIEKNKLQTQAMNNLSGNSYIN